MDHNGKPSRVSRKVKSNWPMTPASPSRNNDSLAGKKRTAEVDGSFTVNHSSGRHLTESAGRSCSQPAAGQQPLKRNGASD